MASFVDKMLAYLGLKDVDDEELYDEYGEPEEQAPRGGHTVYPDHDLPEPPPSNTVRPLIRDDGREGGQRTAVVRPLIPNRSAKPQVVAPTRFNDAQEIGDLVRRSNPVIVNLEGSDRDLTRRMVDFCSGVTYALGGSMEKVAEHVFLLTPPNVEVPAEERQRLTERGLFHS